MLIKNECSDALRNKSMLNSCLSGRRLLSFMKNVTFKGTSGKISFDANGDMTGQYDILQFIFGRTQLKRLLRLEPGTSNAEIYLSIVQRFRGSTKKTFTGPSFHLIFQNHCAANLVNESSTKYNKKCIVAGSACIADTMNML